MIGKRTTYRRLRILLALPLFSMGCHLFDGVRASKPANTINVLVTSDQFAAESGKNINSTIDVKADGTVQTRSRNQPNPNSSTDVRTASNQTKTNAPIRTVGHQEKMMPIPEVIPAPQQVQTEAPAMMPNPLPTLPQTDPNCVQPQGPILPSPTPLTSTLPNPAMQLPMPSGNAEMMTGSGGVSHPRDRMNPSLTGQKLNLGVNENAAERAVILHERLVAEEAKTQALQAQVQSLQKELENREKELQEAKLQLEAATSDVVNARKDLESMRKQIQELRDRLNKVEKEDVETLKALIQTVEKFLLGEALPAPKKS